MPSVGCFYILLLLKYILDLHLCNELPSVCTGGSTCASTSDPTAFPECKYPVGTRYTGSGCNTAAPSIHSISVNQATGIISIIGNDFSNTIDVYYGPYGLRYFATGVTTSPHSTSRRIANIYAPPGYIGDGLLNMRIKSTGLVSADSYCTLYKSIPPVPLVFLCCFANNVNIRAYDHCSDPLVDLWWDLPRILWNELGPSDHNPRIYSNFARHVGAR